MYIDIPRQALWLLLPDRHRPHPYLSLCAGVGQLDRVAVDERLSVANLDEDLTEAAVPDVAILGLERPGLTIVPIEVAQVHGGQFRIAPVNKHVLAVAPVGSV